jgi:AGZA family xanthine/uracil permease-like MFS transporter
MTNAAYGPPIPSSGSIGRPVDKRLDAHAGDLAGVGLVITYVARFRLLAFVNGVIQIAVAAPVPVPVVVALSLITSAAWSIKPAQLAAAGFAILRQIPAFLVTKRGSLMNALRNSGVEGYSGLGGPELTAALLINVA